MPDGTELGGTRGVLRKIDHLFLECAMFCPHLDELQSLQRRPVHGSQGHEYGILISIAAQFPTHGHTLTIGHCHQIRPGAQVCWQIKATEETYHDPWSTGAEGLPAPHGIEERIPGIFCGPDTGQPPLDCD